MTITTNIITDNDYPEDIEITEGNVKNKIMELKKGKPSGPDGITTRFMIELGDQMLTPLTSIFRFSLKNTTIPKDWKIANITPLFKKGSKSDVSNYRPVSLTSIACKMFESIIKDKITSYMDTKNLINDSQHGFRQKRSCTTNLITYWDHLTQIIEEGDAVDVIYLDLRKAFDTVPHKKLMVKIRAHGIRGSVANWIEEWLKERKHRVVLNGYESSWINVKSSVVQGSVLGPMCFNIFMNDMEKGLTSYVSKFADDTKVVHRIRHEEDSKNLQADLDKLYEWTRKWQMGFNIDKCSVIHIGHKNPQTEFKLNGKILQSKDEEKDLGVIVHKTLKSSRQCAEAVKKANKVIGMIRRNFKNFNKKIMLNLYKSLVRPHVDYCIQVWNPYLKKDIKLVEGVQRRMTRLIKEVKHLEYEQRLQVLHLNTLEQRHIRQDLITMYNIMNKKMDIDPTKYFDMFTQKKTRGHQWKIRPVIAKLDVRKYSFVNRVWKYWNRLPDDVVMASTLLKFKSGLRNSRIFKGF